MGGAKQAVILNLYEGKIGSDIESVGGAKQAVIWNWWVGLYGIGGWG